jgi:acyl carrier protein
VNVRDGIDEEVRRVVAAHSGLTIDVKTLGDEEDLYRLGMSSHANVNVMLALEDTFDIEFPEEMLRQATFQSLSAIRRSVSLLVQVPSA